MMQKNQTLRVNISLRDYNKFTGEILNANIKEKGLVDKSDFSEFIDKKIVTLATKTELKSGQYKIVKLQAFDSSYFIGTRYFENDGTQNYLVFQPVYRYFKNKANRNHTSA